MMPTFCRVFLQTGTKQKGRLSGVWHENEVQIVIINNQKRNKRLCLHMPKNR